MGPWLIIGVGFVYAGIALDQAIKGSWANTIVFSGYAFSNIGLFIMAK